MNATMRAVQLRGYDSPEMLHYTTVDRPTVAAGEVLIAVHSAGVNPLDAKLCSGFNRVWEPFKLPVILGFDVAGVIEAVGAGVNNFAVGDEVYAAPEFGGFAEYVAVAADNVAHKPHPLDFVQAAAMPTAATTAWQGLFNTALLTAGQRILVHGAAGGVGTYAVQLAKWRGAHVIGTASAHNLAYLHELGADEAVDYNTPFEESVRGVDIVLDLVGGEAQARLWRVLNTAGRLVMVNNPVLPTPQMAKSPLHIFKMMRPIGYNLAEIARVVDAGHVKPVISARLPLHEAAQAIAQIASRHTRGKIVLQVRE